MTARVVHINDHIPNRVYIGRTLPHSTNHPGGLPQSPLANPFSVERYGRIGAIARYNGWLTIKLAAGDAEVIDALIECRNRPLACFCRRDGQEPTPDNECHGDEILAVLDAYTDDDLRVMRPTVGASGPED